MIGNSRWDYFRIRLSIACLRLIAPASIIYLGASLFNRQFLVSPWIGIYVILEASFFLCVYVPRRARMQRAVQRPPPLTRHERQALFQKCADYVNTGDRYPTGWFTHPDFKRQNVVDWLLWALFSSDAVDQTWEGEIDGYVEAVEKLLGRKLEPGYNETAKSMRLTLDPVIMVHRPLVWYIIVSIVDTWSSLSLYSCGFRHYSPSRWFQVFPTRPLTLLSNPSADPSLPYWYRPHKSNTKFPIVFIHGIGIGLWPYIPLLKEVITQDPDVGILAIELLPISMRITSPPLSRTAMCHAITQILDSLNIPRFVLVAHSYGTVISAHMLHSPSLAPRISSTVFIDPIPFLLHLPNVAFNFIYRTPRRANEWQLWFFASRDPDVAYALSRHFFWTENVMWKEELEGKKVAVVLSGSDQIVNSREVRKYLTGEEQNGEEPEAYWEKDGLEVLFFPKLDHATVFDTKERRRPVLSVIKRFVDLT